MSITLNTGQQEAVAALNGEETEFLLKGYAGTGKTTTIVQWLNELEDKKVVFTAPTNKATNVLKEMAQELEVPVDTCTIHSLLALKMRWKDGQQILAQDERDEPRYADYDIVVVDECSMLSQELMNYLRAAQGYAPKTKLIFMGDPCQLPPIGEDESESFAVEPSIELTEVVRQNPGPIVDCATYIRGLILHCKPGYPSKIWDYTDQDSPQLTYAPAAKHENEILDSVANPGDEDIRILAWTNKLVDEWNHKVRCVVHQTDSPPEWSKGEHVVTLGPVMNPQESEIIFSTDTLLRLHKEPEEAEREGIPCWKLVARGRSFFVVQAQAKTLWHQKREELLAAAKADKKQWRNFYRFMETFALVRPAHAMTVHRSQGSTFDRVYLCLNNITANPRKREMLQCLYVALTRARKQVILI